ncbi:hypothetical protein Airi02_084730 [Actinoallomurus iriomotensis]|uniref:Uncharacterized protein n=1 Tax=Actinoallomurus iriomotensis TaxID=478107 RepID=A0A9W6SAX2_9ACTN|nr:hypothetical protein Airi02_084730 [Actinoallomurus iriomotensis]
MIATTAPTSRRASARRIGSESHSHPGTDVPVPREARRHAAQSKSELYLLNDANRQDGQIWSRAIQRPSISAGFLKDTVLPQPP